MISDHEWEARWLALTLFRSREFHHGRDNYKLGRSVWTGDNLLESIEDGRAMTGAMTIDSAMAQFIAMVCPELRPLPSEVAEDAPPEYNEAAAELRLAALRLHYAKRT